MPTSNQQVGIKRSRQARSTVQAQLTQNTQVINTWITKPVTVLWSINPTSKQTTELCQTHGLIAVHPSIDHESYHRKGMWCVTSVSCGACFAAVRTEEDAKRIALFLWSKCAMELREKDWRALRTILPKWVKPWILTCKSEQAYVDPAPFIQATRR